MNKLIHSWQVLLVINILLAAFVMIGGFILASVDYQFNQDNPWLGINLDHGAISLRFGASPTSTLTGTAVLSLYKATPSLTPFQPMAPTPTFTVMPTPTGTPTPEPTAIPTTTPKEKPAENSNPNPTEQEPEPLIGEDGLPVEAYVTGVSGHQMYYSLDCEARSAVDLAAFFGIQIDHKEFLDRLPYTDDPETGYVGNYRGAGGNIPPYSYGVHAAPVASLLQEYGLNAASHKGMDFEVIRQQIAAGLPVMVWVVGNVQFGTPVEYTAESTGNTTIVAAYEHTVLVTGYTPDYVIIQDGWDKYKRSIRQFKYSWGVLGNMAITVN